MHLTVLDRLAAFSKLHIFVCGATMGELNVD
jgi:hypothetical protein